MERIRLGNNIAISWALYDLNGRVHSLDGKDIQLYMSCGGLKQAVTDYTIQGNVVSWVFLGTEQKKVGLYKLILVETDALSGAQCIDVAEAFRLVSETHSAVETGEVTKNVSVRSVLTYSNLVGVESVDVVESSEDGGTNLVSIRLVDGNVVEIPVKNGSKGLKGDKGDKGDTGPKGDKGDIGERGPVGIDSVEASIGTNYPTQAPSVDKELTDGVLSLTFNNIKGQKGDKGDQGNTGSSVDYPYELVNNVTTDDATKGLSAAQGVVLDGKISQLGQQVIYDVTKNNPTAGPNNDGKFESLSALLSDANLSTLIPIAVRCGGMSIRFVQTSDNKYVQYRLTADEFTTDTTQWAIADEGVYVENPEFVYVKTDKEGKILWAIKVDGDIYYGAGCPQQVKDYINEKIADLSLDEYEDIVAFLSDYLGSDTTLKTLLDSKLDAEGLDTDALGTVQAVENPEYIQVTSDSEGKVIASRNSEGVKTEAVGLKTPKIHTTKLNIDDNLLYNMDNMEDMSEVVMDCNGKVVSYRKKDGTKVECVRYEGEPFLRIENEISKIEGYFPEYKYLPKIASLKRTLMVDGMGLIRTDYSPLVLATITDVHASVESMKNFLDFAQKYHLYIDDTFSDGDIVRYLQADYPEEMTSLSGFDKMLQAVGNHDVMLTESSIISEAEAYARYLNNIDKWGVNYTPNLCYYYKDYPYSKVRLVVLDSNYWGASQKSWLQGVLYSNQDSALNKGYHVIIAQHIPINTQNSNSFNFEDNFNVIDCTFSALDHSTYSCVQTDGPEVVNEFQNLGGIFICWIFGHWHWDLVATLKDYPQQLVIVQNSSEMNSKNSDWGDTCRIKGTYSENLFNLYSIEPEKKYITILRLGADYDRYLRHKGSLCISYTDKRVISNN